MAPSIAKSKSKITEPRGEEVVVRGRISRIFFSSPEFSAGRISDERTGKDVPFSGKFFAAEGDHLVLTGRIVNHSKYGEQIDVTSVARHLRLAGDGLAQYLANNPHFKGLGPVKAGLIAREFGESFSDVIMSADGPARVAAIAKIPVCVAEEIQSTWRRNLAENAVATQLAAWGLTHHQIQTLISTYGDDAASVVTSNPYLLAGSLKGWGFKRVDEIARRLKVPRDMPHRIRAGVLHLVDEALNDGHTWIEERDLLKSAVDLLMLDRDNAEDLVENHINDLIREKRLVSEPRAGRSLIAITRIWEIERDLYQWLSTSDRDNPHALEMLGAVDRIRTGDLGEGLLDGQKSAAVCAIANAVCVISGGAGTGKTHTLKRIVETFEAYNLEVTLCAPTGKAAKRIEELVGRSASTIHRLLGYDGKTWQYGPECKLDADVVVIDETSMVDVELAWRLLGALDLESTSVIFVGDHHQLPPVGAGNLLRDLIEMKIAPAVVLNQVVRQAGELKFNSSAILRGQVAKTSNSTIDESTDKSTDKSTDAKPWYLIPTLATAQDIVEFLGGFFAEVIVEKLKFHPIVDVQVLTPTRKGPIGVPDLNRVLQRIVQRIVFHREIPSAPENKRPPFYPGDKVIQRRNNYDLGIMNGTIGVVVETDVDGKGDLWVDFSGGTGGTGGTGDIVRLRASEGHIHEIDLAYALTIHQTQGSEFPCVVVIAHKSHSFMHSRNLLYTAVTRARKTVVICGDAWGIRNCAARAGTVERRTWLGLPAAD